MKKKKIIPNLPASSGALVVYQGKILLIRRDNKPTIPNPNMWSIPGGQVEKGESFDEALLREIREEIGISPKNYQLLGFLKMKSDQVQRAIYLVRLNKGESKKIKLGDEGQELRWFKPHEIANTNAVPEIKDFFQKNAEEIGKIIKNRIKTEELKNSLKTKISANAKFVLLDFKDHGNRFRNST
jgi:8-oxo-dGTP diphosphatase